MSLCALGLLFLSGCTLNIRSVFKSPKSSYHWTFDATDTASYLYPSSIDFAGGVCRLKPAGQLDDATTGFSGGNSASVAWDPSTQVIRLSQTGSPTSTAELDSSWTPKWSNLVEYLNLNGSGVVGPTLTAAIGNSGNAVTTTSGTAGTGVSMTYVNGKLSQALQGSGTEAYAFTATVANGSSSSFTYAFWASPNAALPGPAFTNQVAGANGLGTTEGVLSAYGGSGSLVGVEVAVGTNGISLNEHAASWSPVVGNYSGPLSGWNHVAIRSVSATQLEIYLNGVYVASAVNTTGTRILAVTGVGAKSAGGWKYFSGKIDDVSIWNTALSANEIQALYSRQSARYSGTFTSRVVDAFSTNASWSAFSWITTLPFMKELPDYAAGAVQNEISVDYTSLVGSTGAKGANDLMNGILGLWHLNETTFGSVPGGYDVNDASGNGYHGSVVGGAGGGVSLGTPGKLGNAVRYNGINGTINLNTTGTVAGTYTFSEWVNFEVVYGRLLSSHNTASGTYATYIVADSSGLHAQLGDGSSTLLTYFADAAYPLVTNRWYHFAYVISPNSYRIYIDGLLAGSGSYTGNALLYDPAHPLTLGYSNFQGRVDEVAMWSRALHPNEILQLYRRGANRIKHQVRVCTTFDCSDDPSGANWKGPDGTNQTYYSELNNNTVPLAMTGTVNKGLPYMLFSNFTAPVGSARYFQYRTILESDDSSTSCDYGAGPTWCSPELKSVKVDPIHFDPSSPAIVGKVGAAMTPFTTFTETKGASCAGGIGYNLSPDQVLWYYWNGTAWAIANGTAAQSNAASVVSAQAPGFTAKAGGSAVYFKAFLKSDGTTPCELDDLAISGL